MEQPRHHTGARAMRTGDANRRLGFSNTFHAKALYNDDPLGASIAENVVHIYVPH